MNPSFNGITEQELDEAPKLRKTLIFDAILSLIRGMAIGALASEFIPLEPVFKYSISSIIGILPTAHSFYVRYQAGHYAEALKQKKQAILKIFDKSKEENEASILFPITSHSHIEIAPKLFDQIAASNNSSALNFAIESINYTARLTRFVAFFLFVETFNQSFLNNSLGNIGIIALVFLWGAEVFKNDGDMYSEALQSGWQGMAAKWQLENESDDTASCTCFSGCFFRPARVVLKSLYDYPYELLEKVAKSAEVESASNIIQ